MVAGIFRQRRRHHALADIGLDQHQRLAVRGLALADRPDIERGMRPGRLREIFDDAGNVIVAFDQQHVARPQRRAQGVGIARRERLIALRRLFQIMGEKPPDPVGHPTHHTVPGVSP